MEGTWHGCEIFSVFKAEVLQGLRRRRGCLPSGGLGE